MEIMMGYAMDFMKAFVYAAVAVGLTFLLKNGSKFKEMAMSLVKGSEAKRIMSEIWDVMAAAVGAINQTYVNNLKLENAFDEAAQLKAKQMAKEAFWRTLSEESKKFILNRYDDYNTFMDTLLEKMVADAKNEKNGMVLVSEGIMVDEVPVEAGT